MFFYFLFFHTRFIERKGQSEREWEGGFVLFTACLLSDIICILYITVFFFLPISFRDPIMRLDE